MAYTDIDNPELYFQAKTFSGNAGTNAITLDGSENMQPDMVWLKKRNGTAHHHLVDSVRGVGRYLFSNLTNAEGGDGFSDDGNDLLRSFDSNGFTIDAGEDANASGATGVAWSWKETATAGFDIVSYTGNATNRTISHSLSAVPKMMIFKRRSTAESWGVYHVSTGGGKFLRLDGTNAEDSEASVFNSTAPTSSVFSLGTSGLCNQNGGTYIGYLFSEKQGYSKFGSYTGNGNTDGTFVYTGFKPAFLMVKRTDTTGVWGIYDNKRIGFNSSQGVQHVLRANSSDATSTGGGDAGGFGGIDFLSNGFKCKLSDGNMGASGGTYLYLSFAEAPFCNSSGVPANAR